MTALLGASRTARGTRRPIPTCHTDLEQTMTDKPTAEPVCLCGHPMRQHHEDVCLTECGCTDGREPETAGDLPDRLEAALTARFTELGNPFSRMRIAFQGPDGWPASKEVGPHDVALVLRELLAAVPAVSSVSAVDQTTRDRIAEALREHYLCTNRDEADADGNLPCRCGDWREPGAEADDENDWDSHLADAALAVLPPTADQAAEAPAAECSAQNRNYESGPRLCIRAAQHTGDHIDERGFHWSDTVAVYPLADGTFRAGVNRAVLRRLAAEAQQPTPVAASEPRANETGRTVAEAQQQPAKTPVGYSGKGRVWCLSCPHPDDENVPVTVDLLQPYEECAGCGRDVVDVALAAAHQAEQHENPEQRTTVEYRADCPICRRKQRSAAGDTSEEA